MGTTTVKLGTEPKTNETDDIIDVRIPKTSKRIICALTTVLYALAIALIACAVKMVAEVL